MSLKLAEISKTICLKFSRKQDEYIIDSVPLPICSNVRIDRTIISRDDSEVMPTRAFYASHKIYYYGRFAARFKMHWSFPKLASLLRLA